MSDIVIREVTQGIWTFSKPFNRFGWLPIGGRSTAIRLKNGGVWLLASTPMSPETKETLDKLGPVQYIVGADAVHHLYLGDYKKAYPTAKLIAPKDAIKRHGDPDLKFDGVWGTDPPETQYGFEDEVKACYFSGFKNKDVAFLHIPSKTLIEADLLFNLPATEQYSKTVKSGRIPILGTGGFYPGSWIHSKLIWNMGLDKEAMRRDARTVASWDFDRIIPCHGDVIETDGKKAWKEVFKSFLD